MEKELKENIEELDEEIKEEINITSTLKKIKIPNPIKKILIRLGKDTCKFILKTVEVIIIFFLFCCFLNWSNDSLVVTEDIYQNESIPASFNGYKILQISDLNGKDITNKLIEETKELNPDIIVFTGDFVNSERSTIYNIDYTYFDECKDYPIYFIPGEQEKDSLIYEDIVKELKSRNVIVLDNERITLTKNEENIDLIGINDSSFFIEDLTSFNNKLKEISNTSNFNILLSHRPELIDIYTENNIDLVLSGHALGGQFRIPFVGAFYSSNQGFYPDYTESFYTQENTTVYVSRGIGNSFIPLRLFNRPEINLIILQK